MGRSVGAARARARARTPSAAQRECAARRRTRLRSHRRLADAALARQHQQHILDAGQARAHGGDAGVLDHHARRRRRRAARARRLVGAALQRGDGGVRRGGRAAEKRAARRGKKMRDEVESGSRRAAPLAGAAQSMRDATRRARRAGASGRGVAGRYRAALGGAVGHCDAGRRRRRGRHGLFKNANPPASGDTRLGWLPKAGRQRRPRALVFPPYWTRGSKWWDLI